jgi:hypothetical protein
MDLRCEFDLPRFVDLNEPDFLNDEENFLWFQTPHDFAVPSSEKVSDVLKSKILAVGSSKTVGNGGQK